MQKLLLVYYYSENRATSQIFTILFPPIWGKNGGVLGMRMQVILDSRFARPGVAPMGGGKKGEFRDWTIKFCDTEKKEPARLIFFSADQMSYSGRQKC